MKHRDDYILVFNIYLSVWKILLKTAQKRENKVPQYVLVFFQKREHTGKLYFWRFWPVLSNILSNWWNKTINVPAEYFGTNTAAVSGFRPSCSASSSFVVVVLASRRGGKFPKNAAVLAKIIQPTRIQSLSVVPELVDAFFPSWIVRLSQFHSKIDPLM